MAKKCGANNGNLSVRIKKEIEEGVDESTGFYLIERTDTYGFKKNNANIESRVVKPGRDQAGFSIGSQEVTGEIETPFDTTASNILLNAHLGTTVSTDAGGGLFNIKHTVRDSCLDSIQVEQYQADINESAKILGAKVNTMEMTIEEDGELYMKFGLNAKFKYTNQKVCDSLTDSVTADAAINTKTIEVATPASFKVGNALIISSAPSALEVEAENSRTIPLADTSAFAKNDKLMIAGKEAIVQSVTAATLFLNREVSGSIGETIYVLNKEYVVESVGGTNIVLVTGLTKAIVTGDTILIKASNSVAVTKEIFKKQKVTIVDNDSGLVDKSVITSLTLLSDNGQIVEKTIGGSNITDGKTKISADIDVVIDKKMYALIDNSENGYQFDLTISVTSDSGKQSNIVLSNCQVIGDLEDGGTDTMKGKLMCYPSKDALGNYFSIETVSEINFFA